jgi:hypothetical protein
MAKTRRKKINKSPLRPYRNAKAFVADKGDMITTMGVRGRTLVKRITDESGKRLNTVRLTEALPQVPAKPVGDRKPTPIFVGRQYTGVPRSKPYPYRSVKRGAVPAPAPVGLLGGLASVGKRLKKVVTGEQSA